MKTKDLPEISVLQSKDVIKEGSYIGDDLVLFDNFDKVPLPAEPRRMQCLFVAVCLEGQAQYTVDTREHLVSAGDVIIISEGQVVSNYMFSPDCKGMAIMSSNSFFHELIKEVHEISTLFLFANTHPVFELSKDKMKIFVSYFKHIKSRMDDFSHHFRKELVMSLLKALIYEVGNEIWRFQSVGETKNSRAETIFASFIRLVEQNFRTERRVGWYGKQLCITPKYLSETVKAVSKRTPNDWIDNYVTLEIRVLLKNSTMSVKEIAQMLNFPSQSFLGKYFKEHVGISPSKYRKS